MSTHSVEEAAMATNASPEDFVKNICLMSESLGLIVAIVKGENRVSTKKVAKILEIARPETASIDEILQFTGYPIGGVPSFGYEAVILIDEKVMEKDFVYTGGGTANSLVKISTLELLRASGGRIVNISK